MPRTRKPRVTAEPNFNADFHMLIKTKEGVQEVLDFMEVFTEVLDQIIGEDNTWFNLGRNKANHGLLLTLHEGPLLSYAAGPNLVDFLRDFLIL